MANQALPTAIKFAEGKSDVLKILAIPYGGPFNGSDLDGERFSKDTDLCLDWFPDTRPLLYDHGHDKDVKTSVVGYFKSSSIEETDEGVWIEAQLNKSSRYFSAIGRLIGENKLYASSGAMGHLVETDKNGNIKRWPWCEQSITVSPSNLLATATWSDVSKHYKSAKLEFTLDIDEFPEELKSEAFMIGCFCPNCRTELKAELSSDERDNLKDSDFAYIDSDGGRHLPINDEAHVKNAISRFGSTKFESDDKKKAAAKKILAAARKYKIEVSDDSTVAEAAKTFFSALWAFEDDEPELKVLMESVDTAGGFLVPEDNKAKKPVEKKPLQQSGEADEDDDDDDDGKSADADALAELVAKAKAAEIIGDGAWDKTDEKGRPLPTSKWVPTVAEPVETPDPARIKISYIVTGEGGEKELKDGEVVVQGSWCDPPEGSLEDWIADLRASLNNAMGPWSRYGYFDILYTFGCNGPGVAFACRYDYDSEETTYWQISFDLGPGGVDPVITNMRAYESVLMPASDVPADALGKDDDDSSTLPIAMVIQKAMMQRAVVQQRTKDLQERRVKEGRVLSSATRDRLQKLLEGWKAAGDDLQALLDSTEPQAKAVVSVDLRELETFQLIAEAQELLKEGNIA